MSSALTVTDLFCGAGSSTGGTHGLGVTGRIAANDKALGLDTGDLHHAPAVAA
jgi:hypothetical protein